VRKAPGPLKAELIETSRLLLRPLCLEDAFEMHAVLAEPALYAFTGGAPPSLEELRGRYERQVVGHAPDGAEAWLNWTVRERDGNSAVGYVQAGVKDEVADLAWLIGSQWQRRGYASEAGRAVCAWLAQRSIVHLRALVHPDHVVSQRVALRMGLSRTGETENGEEVWASASTTSGPPPRP